MAPTGSHSSGSQRRILSDYDLQHRRDVTRHRQRRLRQTVRDEADATKSCEPQYDKGKRYTASPKDEERGEDQEQGPNIFDSTGPGFSKALTEDTTVNPLHQQQRVISPVQLSSALGLDVEGGPISLAKPHPSLPDRPVVVELPPRTIVTTIASSLREKPRSTSDSNATSRLTRDLWDTRREMTALQARETDLVASLRRLDAPLHILESGRAQKSSELEVRLAEVENELRRERYKRLRAERGLNVIETEKRAPFVVPALFRAFLMISEMNG